MKLHFPWPELAKALDEVGAATVVNIGVHGEPTPGIKPDEFAREVIQHYLKMECICPEE